MNAPMPVGWGFAAQPKEAFDREAALEREIKRRVARQLAADQHHEALLKAKASRKGATRSYMAQKRMRAALWLQKEIATTGRWPSGREVAAKFGVSMPTAYAFIADFEQVIQEDQP